VVLPLVVVVLKMMFAVLMKKLVDLRRHKYEMNRIQWEVKIITLFYFIKTGLIKWFLYQSFAVGSLHFELLTYFMPLLTQLAKILPIQPDKIHLFHDFDKEWVAHTSHRVILIALLAFNFSIVLYYLTNIIFKKCNQYRAAKQPTFKKMKELLKGSIFQIEFVAADGLALFLFCMIYFSCMPIIYFFCLASMILLYWVAKYKFVRLDQKPPVYAHTIS
jgi:hypothetical protein